MSEKELLRRFRDERSDEAFAELVRQYADLVYSVARRRLANATLAEDVTQLVFIRFAKAPPKVENHSELVAWLHRTTLNLAIDTWRSETRRRTREQEAVAMEIPMNAPNTSALWEEISPKLDEALNQLKDEDRQALLLRFFARKAMRDVGAALGVSEDAAKMRVSRAVERLRTQLGITGATVSAVVLGTLLAENSVVAAPGRLISGLVAMRMPVTAGLAGMGGWLALLLRASKARMAMGALVLALGSWYALHQLGPGDARMPQEIAKSPFASAAGPTQGARRQQPEWTGPNAAAMAPGKAVKILFHVLDRETGVALANTRIRYVFFGPGGEGESHEILTDIGGNAPIQEPDDPSKNSGPNVFLTAEAHVPKVVGFPGRETPTEYTIQLDPAITASGVVVDEQESAIAGVQIFIQGPGNKEGTIENVDFQTCPVSSHEDGTWACSYIPKDYTNELRFILKKPGYAVTFPVVPVAKVGLTGLVLLMNRGFVIAGQVTDAQGQPIRKAEIKIVSGMPDKRQSARTDDHGWFTLAGVAGDTAPNGVYNQPPLQTNAAGAVLIRGLAGQGQMRADLAVQAPGYASQTVTVELLSPTNLANFTLAQGNVLRGLVLDPAGNPIPNAVVRTDFDFKHQFDSGFKWSAHTDEHGRFEWDSAPAQEICYWFEAGGYAPIRGLPLAADGTEHRITLQQGGRN